MVSRSLPRPGWVLALASVLAGFALPPGFAFELGLPERVRLPNGLMLIVQRVPGRPLVGMSLATKMGGAYETSEEVGYGLLTQVLWQRLESTKSQRDLSIQLQHQGAYFDAKLTADSLVGQVSFPKEALAEVLPLAKAWIETREPSSVAFEAAQKACLERQERLSKDRGLRRGLWEQLHRLAFRGETKDMLTERLRRATPQKLAGYLDRRLVPNQSVLVLVGDLPGTEELIDLVQAQMNQVASREAPPELKSRPENAPKSLRVSGEDDKALWVLGFPAPSPFEPDFYALWLLHVLLTEGDQSLLNAEMVRDKSLVRKVDSHLGRYGEENLLSFRFQGPTSSFRRSQRHFFEVLNRLQRHGVSRDDLEAARAAAKVSRAYDLQRKSQQAEHLGRAELLGDFELVSDFGYFLDRVGVEDLKRVLAEYLTPEKAFRVEALPEDFEASEASSRHLETYTKGVQVVLRQDPSSEVVGLSLVRPGGFDHESEQELGYTALLKAYLPQSEPEVPLSHSQEMALKAHAASLRPIPGGFDLAFSIECTTFGFEEILGAVHKMVSNPRWDAGTFEKARIQALEWWGSLAKRPQSFGSWGLRTRLFAGTRHARKATDVVRSLEAATLEGLKAFHQKLFAQEATTLGVVGRLSMIEVDRVVQKVFQVKPEKRKIEAKAPAPYQRQEGFTQETVDIEDDEDVLWVGVKLPTSALEDFAAVSVWFNLLGLGSDSLLFSDLKKLDPGVSSKGNTIQIPHHGGMMAFGFGVEKGMGKLAIKRSLEVMRAVGREKISAETITQTARKIRTALLFANEQRQSEAHSLATYVDQFGAADFTEKLIREYAKLDVDSVQKVAAKYLDHAFVLLYQAKAGDPQED